MDDKVDLATVDEHFSPRIVGYLIEPKGTVNTGDAGGPLTAAEREL